MRIIFLDIDGVLNSFQSSYWYHNQGYDNSWVDYRGDSKEISIVEKMLCPLCCNNLKMILDRHPDVQIVVSSTWRKGRTIEKLNLILKYHKIISEDRVIGKTLVLNKHRGYEIQNWIEDYEKVSGDKIKEFIILDDDSDMGPYLNTPHFIKTSGKVGFDYITMEKVDIYFGEFNLKFEDLKEKVPYKMFSKPREALYYKEGTEMVYYSDNSDDLGARHSAFFYPEKELFSVK